MARPVVSGLDPSQGPVSGGNLVVITGSGFSTVGRVAFGAASAPFIINSDTQITAAAPPATGPATVNVTVSGPLGTSTDQAPYTYVAVPPQPVVTLIAPDAGPELGGNTVTIRGVGLSQTTAVHFGTTPAQSFAVVSDNEVTATAPAGTGTVQVTVTTPAGTSRTEPFTLYSYLGIPTVVSVQPTQGSSLGGESVLIVGSSFTHAADVLFGSALAVFTVVSDTQIVARTPGGTGTVAVTVLNVLGEGSSTATFTYV
ncbi:hypothetical protein Arub01_02420 [Actinomadura rubrobrunea]|uniref:IPT/TIG domain-containing protein n=1 Tax=Actinomadura rubrobrunea TaxID=115335 RepID=A0A9W6UTP5_9ACTN|nr:IPT/TIG domain-containing protein [Actinomadura rubrobrunea]GLW61998.1 hypothetical protein Arub01_02420 [Actinomadura rubrobrunea]